MNDASIEFNKQLELDVLVNGLTKITDEYVSKSNLHSLDVLDEVVIPDGVTTIGYEAFYGCEYLKSVTIPSSVKKIENYAFYYCGSLTNVIIPPTVTSIGDTAFWDCGGLIRITFKGRTFAEICSMRGYPWGIPPENISVRVW